MFRQDWTTIKSFVIGLLLACNELGCEMTARSTCPPRRYHLMAKLEELLKYVVRGLAWYRWGLYFDKDWSIRVMFLPELLSGEVKRRFDSLNRDRVVTADLGKGTVQYEVAALGQPIRLIILVIALYGGVMLAGSGDDTGFPTETSRLWWVIAGDRELAEQIENRSHTTVRPDSRDSRK